MPTAQPVQLYDTTLRDGTQREGLSLSVDDKVKIARALDQLGVRYIEGGWPGSNPKDAEFFRRIRETPLHRARVAACDLRGKVLGPWLPARARLIDDPATLAAGQRAVRAKYGWQSWIGDCLSTLSGRIRRRAWIEIELSNEPVSPPR